MDDSLTEPKVAARRWTFRIPAYILLPFYLMLIGVALRYAVYIRNTGNWEFTQYLRALCVYDCNAYERLALNGGRRALGHAIAHRLFTQRRGFAAFTGQRPGRRVLGEVLVPPALPLLELPHHLLDVRLALLRGDDPARAGAEAAP